MSSDIPQRALSPDLLASLEKSHPFEAGVARTLIERGIWTLTTENRQAGETHAQN